MGKTILVQMPQMTGRRSATYQLSLKPNVFHDGFLIPFDASFEWKNLCLNEAKWLMLKLALPGCQSWKSLFTLVRGFALRSFSVHSVLHHDVCTAAPLYVHFG